MLLIPLPQEDSVRRQPWVTYALIALNTLIYLGIDLGYDERRSERRLRLALEDVIEYLVPRPYLEVPEAARPFLDPDQWAGTSAERGATQRPPPSPQLERERAELDALAKRVADARNASPYARLGLIPAKASVPTYLSSMFVHGGWLHLIGNMLFLYLTGPFVEDVFGRILYPALYLVGGVVASMAHIREQPDSLIPLVGASGAIAAVMGAFLVRFAMKRIKLLVVPIPFFPVVRFTALLPAFLVLPAWFGQQFWYANQSADGSGVAWWAHIGGFVFGAIVALGIKLTGLEEGWLHPTIEAKSGFEQHAGVVQATQLRLHGEYVTARRELRAALAAQPRNLDAWAEAYELSLAEDDADATGQAAARLLDLYARAGEKELARKLLYDVSQRAPEPMPSRYHLAAASFLERDGDARSALDHYERVSVLEPETPAGFRALYRRGELLRRAGDARGAREAYEQMRRHPACVDPWPETIERALAELDS